MSNAPFDCGGRGVRETGTLFVKAPRRVALLYPAPYRVAGSSLGLQVVYRALNRPGELACERVVLEEGTQVPRSMETGTPLSRFDAIAVSVAYELELGPLASMLLASGIPPMASDRGPEHPAVIAGGPLTRSNARLLARLCDAVVVGDGEEALPAIAAALCSALPGAELAGALEGVPGVWPCRGREAAEPRPQAAPASLLPALGQTTSPDTDLRDMFLVEVSRGCPRACAFCVTARGTAPFRFAPAERVLAEVPDLAKRVGLVGAAVSDTPDLAGLVRGLAQSGRTVGISSLRADRLGHGLVEALASAGMKALTVAADASSERLRSLLGKEISGEQLLAAARLARAEKMRAIKVYAMVGLPSERDSDVDELARLCVEMSRVLPLRVAANAFVPKRHTPLESEPFGGVETAARRIERLRSGLRGRALLRAASTRWAEVEWRLSHAGPEGWDAAVSAARAGGTIRDWRRALGTDAGGNV